jgi:LytS/YehU family sensor histidine kinase
VSPALPMPEPQRHTRLVLVVFGTGLAVGLHLGFLHLGIFRSFSPEARGSLTSPRVLLTFATGSLGFAAITYTLWRWVFPRLGGRTLGRQLVRQVAVSLAVMTVASVATIELVTQLAGVPSLFGAPLGVERHVTITPAMRQMAARLYAVMPIVPTVLMTIIGYHQIWRRIRSLEDRQRALTELAATAQLAALRAQINPHFLFNSLNSIAELIHADPDKAEACVQRLAEIFRYILRRAAQEFVPLADELQMAQAYLDIERARFGDRLRVETAVDARSLQHLIPNLVLQPLVENAVKHGLSRKLGPGHVRIAASVTDGTLTLTVADDGLGMTDATLAAVYERGVGLRNLRDRLVRLYGAAHLPEISSAPGAGTAVRLRLPARTVEAAA